MKTAALYGLLLVTVTVVSGDSGALTISNHGNYRALLQLKYHLKDGYEYVQPAINPGETMTTSILEGATDTSFKIHSTDPNSNNVRSTLVDIKTPMPVKLCFKASGTDDKPEIGQTDCKTGAPVIGPGDGGVVSVTSNATYSTKLNLKYQLKADKGTQRWFEEETSIALRETKMIRLPNETYVTYLGAVLPSGITSNLLTTQYFNTLKLCLKIWGTEDNPQSTQIDC